MGVRFRRAPGVTALGFACWELGIEAPTGMPLRGPDMLHTDMRLVSASREAAGPDEAHLLAVGLRAPFVWIMEGKSEKTAAYVSLASTGPWLRALMAGDPSYWDPGALAGEAADPTPDSGPDARRHVAVSIELPELAGLVALRFAAVCFRRGGAGSAVPPGLLWEEALPATARAFFLRLSFRSPWRRAGDALMLESALRKVRSCFSIELIAGEFTFHSNP
jgi:hypothetical protein